MRSLISDFVEKKNKINLNKMTTKNTSRRAFITDAAKTTAAIALSATVLPSFANKFGEKNSSSIPYKQRPLLYGYADLEIAIDATTMEIHYTKHAAAYAKNLGEAVIAEKVDTNSVSLESLMGNISKYSTKMRNNGGGHFNHELFWQSLTPKSSQKPEGKLLAQIEKDFGSFDAFKTKFADAGKTRFGSGWAWLVLDKNNKLVIGSTANQDNPLMDVSELKGTPLLGLDVWEHAYYLKYQNKRPDYINAFWSIVNWEVVAKRFEA